MNKPSSGAVESGRLFSRVSRPQNVVYPGLLTALTAHISGASYAVAGAGYVLIMLIYALAAGFNNLHDIATDTVNARTDNPLVGGQVSLKKLNIFFAACVLIITVSQTVFSQPWTLALVIVYGCLLTGYSHPAFHIMSRGLWATLLLAACYGSLPLLIGAVQGERLDGTVAIYASLLQLGLLFPVLLAKDYKDLKGDAATGKRTPLVRYGPKVVSCLASVISLTVSVAYLFLLTVNGYDGCNVIPVTALSVAYVVLVRMLHGRQPRPPKSIRLLLTIVMLAMTLLALKCYTDMV